MTATTTPATPAQIAYLDRLLASRRGPNGETFADTLGADAFGPWLAVARRSKRDASIAIDFLAGWGTEPVSARRNRYAGACHRCGQTVPAGDGTITRQPSGRWIVTHDGDCPARPAAADLPEVPAGHYAIASTGTNDLAFYRVDRPTEGRYAGRTFVKLVVGGRPDSPVAARNIPGILARIVEAGINEAAALYGREIGRCHVCNRHLTDEASRRAGIGPDCASRWGIPQARPTLAEQVTDFVHANLDRLLATTNAAAHAAAAEDYEPTDR